MPSETTGAIGLAGRYATALFELADEAKSLDAVAGDLERLGAMIEGSDDLKRLIRSPVLTRDEQGRAIAAVMERAEIGALVHRFVGVVAGNRRLFALPAMIASYMGLLAARRGERTAEVASAAKLTDAQMSALQAALKRAVGSEVAVSARVDPKLIGGLVVRIGSRMIDSSLATKLQMLRLAMKGTG